MGGSAGVKYKNEVSIACLVLVAPLLLARITSSTPARVMAPPQANVNSMNYPETADGLRALVEDLFKADKHQKKSSQIYSGLAIPNAKAWFVKTFGPVEGGRMDAKYGATGEKNIEWLRSSIHDAVEQKRTYPIVKVIERPEDSPAPLYKAVTKAMANPTLLYAVSNSKGPDDKSPFPFGDFVYVDGGFRYLSGDVMRALSTAPPLRIRVAAGGDVLKLVKKVEPIYPPEAMANKIQGPVKLHIVLATDGSVMKLTVVSGEPALAQAAQDAVKQWRYQPTLLNDEAVEVDTEIGVTFSLKR